MMNRFFVCLALSMCVSTSLWAATAQNMDIVQMSSGNIVEGAITSRTATHITMETLGGRLVLPINSIKTMDEARPGESELVLGLEFMQRNNFERAKDYLQKSSRYTIWHHQARESLSNLQKKEEALKEQKQEQERLEIERLIQRKGLKAGINEIQKRHRTQQDEYWGSYRGRMHLLLARERLDHMDVKGAENHLAQAEKYGANPEQWNEVRQEIVDFRSKSLIFGNDALAMRRKFLPKKTAPVQNTDWLESAKLAQQKGERIPPVEWLHWVNKYSVENNLDPLLVWAIIDTESSWRKDVVSHAGAQGLMQLMPMTAGDMNVSDPFDPEQNIMGGTKYMKFLMTMFGDVNKALAAYNVGPGRLERSPTMPEAAKRYINKVTTRYATLKSKFAEG